MAVAAPASTVSGDIVQAVAVDVAPEASYGGHCILV